MSCPSQPPALSQTPRYLRGLTAPDGFKPEAWTFIKEERLVGAALLGTPETHINPPLHRQYLTTLFLSLTWKASPKHPTTERFLHVACPGATNLCKSQS